MDKQEYREIVSDIKRAYDKQEYEKLLMYADELELRRVSDARVLEMISDAYEATGQTEEAMQVLTRAYEKTPMGRKMAYKLGEMAIRQGDLDKAVEYYEEFSRMAPNDNSRLLLKYKIGKAGNVNKADLAKVLDNYCSKEMDDQWMYELAKLYDEMGEREKSVEICDDIILWFAGGDYTEKAYQLKNKNRDQFEPAAVPEEPAVLEEESSDEISEITAAAPENIPEEDRQLRPETGNEDLLAGQDMDSILEEYITIEDATAQPEAGEAILEDAAESAPTGDTKIVPVDEIRKHIAQEPAPVVAQAQKFAYSAENMPVIEEAEEDAQLQPEAEALSEEGLPEISDEELEDMIAGQEEFDLGDGSEIAEEIMPEGEPEMEAEPEIDEETETEAEAEVEEEEKVIRQDDQLFRAVTENGKPFSNIIAMNSARSAPPKEDDSFWKMPEDLSVEEKEADPDEPVFGSHRWFEQKNDEPEFEEPVYGAHRYVKEEETEEEAPEEESSEGFVSAGEGDIFGHEENETEEFVIEEMEPEPIRIEHPAEEPEMTGRISTIKTAASSAAFTEGVYETDAGADVKPVMSDQAEFVKKPAFGQHKYEEMDAVAAEPEEESKDLSHAEPSDAHILHPLTAHGIWPSTPEPEAMAAAEPVAEEAPEPEAEPEPVIEPEPAVEPEPVTEPEPEEDAPKPFMFRVMPNQPVEEKIPEAAMLAAQKIEEPEPEAEPVPESPVFAKHFEPEPAVEPEPVIEPIPVSKPRPVIEPEPAAEPEPVIEPEPVAEAEPELIFEQQKTNDRARQLFMDETEKEHPVPVEDGPQVIVEEPEKPERAMHIFDFHKEEQETVKEPAQPELSGFEKAMKLFEEGQQDADELEPGEFEDVLNDVVEANQPWEEPEFGLPDTEKSEFKPSEFIGNDFDIDGEEPWAISDDELEELTGAAEEEVKKPEVPELNTPIEVTQRVDRAARMAREATQRFEPVKDRPIEVTQRVDALKRQAAIEAFEAEAAKEAQEQEIANTESITDEPLTIEEPIVESAAWEPVEEEMLIEESDAPEYEEPETTEEQIVLEMPEEDEEQTVSEEPVVLEMPEEDEEQAVSEEPVVLEVPEEDEEQAVSEEPVALEIAEEEEEVAVAGLPEAEEVSANGYTIPEEFRDELSEFLIVDGMEERICHAIGNIVDRKLSGDASGGNLIVTGDPKSGKTYLIISIIKAIGKETGSSAGKVAKVQAEALNGKDMDKVFAKIAGSDLVVENAGYLNDDTIESLIKAMKKDTRGTMVVLEGNSLGVENIMVKHPELDDLFCTRLDLDELSLSQWADLACEYAKEQGYHIGDMALLALHARIDEMNLPTTRLVVDDVKGIVDDAIRKAGRRGGKRRHRKGKDNTVELDETDFM